MKANLKKLFLVGTAGFVLAACGNGGDSEQTAEDANDETAGTAEDTSWQDVQEEGVLVVGTEGTYAPITYVDENNELTGYDVELMRAIGEELGVEVQFETMQFDAILPALRNGQIDMAANDMAITEEREDIFDFTVPYKYSYGSIITLAENDDMFESAYDLEGHDVALGSLTSNYAQFAEAVGANGTAYDGGVDAILRDVLSGNTMAYLNDVLTLNNNLEEFGDDRLIVDEDVKYHPSTSAFPVLKGNLELRDQLSGAIETLREEGVISDLSEEFLGADVSEPVDGEEVVNFEDLESEPAE